MAVTSDTRAPAPAYEASSRESDQGALNRAYTWIVGDDTGSSSTAIWSMMMRGKVDTRWLCHPFDPADLGRCLRLLFLIPEWRPGLNKMRFVSKEWDRLVTHWDQLEKAMADEVGIDWSMGQKAPKTYALMQLALAGEL